MPFQTSTEGIKNTLEHCFTCAKEIGRTRKKNAYSHTYHGYSLEREKREREREREMRERERERDCNYWGTGGVGVGGCNRGGGERRGECRRFNQTFKHEQVYCA